MRKVIEQVLPNRILFIGENKQEYTGCPNDLINELEAALKPTDNSTPDTSFGLIARTYKQPVSRS